MEISLKNYAKQEGNTHVSVKIDKRLPKHLLAPCELACDFTVLAQQDYFLISLDVQAELTISCQRCLATFCHHFNNQTQLAVCADDDIAERLMDSFECIVSPSGCIDLTEVLTDELHLFSMEKHSDVSECDLELKEYLNLP